MMNKMFVFFFPLMLADILNYYCDAWLWNRFAKWQLSLFAWKWPLYSRIDQYIDSKERSFYLASHWLTKKFSSHVVMFLTISTRFLHFYIHSVRFFSKSVSLDNKCSTFNLPFLFLAPFELIIARITEYFSCYQMQTLII